MTELRRSPTSTTSPTPSGTSAYRARPGRIGSRRGSIRRRDGSVSSSPTERSRAATDEESIAMTQSPSMIVQTEFTTAPPTTAADRAWIRPWLRAEGLAVLAAGLAGFLFLGLPWWVFLLLLIVPDVSMVGYLRGPRVGAIAYNVAHDLFTGVALTGLGLALGSVPLATIGTILVAHSGMDRMMGYGLKLPSSFQDTHLGRIGRDPSGRRPG
jgi:hypothetical protein